ncbi:hypothetical protein [Psychrobacillus vulpis]|uniref:Uncharacterized protein n=1 Tax=Psychrobacillus vulpis TaxID=2325572 RepID=A0A544TW50_9BACI|nr:hypothetical protein [Psychrobacillus vulpis]TQR21679.1 hypothetical protein FG384_01610 [Psychrobacillus vulpis]
MISKQALAVKNNAEWCEIISLLHRCQTRVENNLWGLDKKAPTYYPDVITLNNDVTNYELLNFIKGTQAEFIKDSYASLKLDEEKFKALFEASWIYYDNSKIVSSSKNSYRKIQSIEELLNWNTAAELDGIIQPDILSNTCVSIYANEGEVITAGFIVNISGDTIGVSNVFSTKEDSDSIWTDIVVTINQNHFADHIVGYESNEALIKALNADWERIGKLKVWKLK